MENMRLREIANAVGGRLIPESMGEACINSVEIDSRMIREGSLFIPIVGERVDGHRFINMAWEKGAVCSLINADHLEAQGEEVPEGKALLVVENGEYALEFMAEAYRSHYPIPIVGVTGSVGKTSCKEFVAAALSQSLRILKTEGNHNNNIGMPLTLFQLNADTEAAVLEMGMDHFGELHRLSRTARPKVAIITNIGISHMENLGSREGILKAKLEITDFMDPDGILFLNGDDERLYGLKGKRSETMEFFGWAEHNDGRILKAEITREGKLLFEASYHGKIYKALLDTPGQHMAYNIMPAIMTGIYLGLAEEQIYAGLEAYTSPDKRLHVTQTDMLTLIDDCYNASPDSMKAALDTLCSIPGEGRRIAILGDMFELGDMEEEGHREVGRKAAQRSEISMVMTVGERASWILEEAKVRGDLVAEGFENIEDLLENVVGKIQKDDIILVKASRGMTFEKICSRLLEL